VGFGQGTFGVSAKHLFHVVLIKPSHYDDDGYVVQWWKAWIPSNSLAVLYGLIKEMIERKLLGEDVDIQISAYDETNAVIPVKKIVRRIKQGGGLVCMVGVQSNQFPRAIDLAKQFRDEGLQVAIGGFHVSGCIAMLPELQADLKEALDLGISLFAGEAEERLKELSAKVLEWTGSMPVLYIREGSVRDELLKLIDEEPSISGLILGAGIGPKGPGPLVTALGKMSGRLRVPLTIVPGSLDEEQIKRLT